MGIGGGLEALSVGAGAVDMVVVVCVFRWSASYLKFSYLSA
jgi:hypothetical protein